MELDRKVRWKGFRDEQYDRIVNGSCSPDDKIKRVTVYQRGLYETPKVYYDGYAVNDGSWVKYYYNGRFRCKNKEEIGRLLYGYVCFLIKAGIEDWEEYWYFSTCFLIDRLEYREGLFGCSFENKKRMESAIRKACEKRPQDVWTAKVDKRGFCLDPQVTKGMTVGEKTRLQKKKMKEKTDAKIAERYDPSLESDGIRDNAKRCTVSSGRLHQWLKEKKLQ